MDRETFKQQLSELFPGEKLNIVWAEERNDAKIFIKREISRLELGHMFSLGSKSLKSLGDRVVISFDLEKASLNSIYQPQIIK